MNLSGYAVLIIAILFGVAGQLLLKYGMSKQPGFRLADLVLLIKNGPVVAGFAGYGISTLLYFKALSSLDLSLAYPTVSLSYVAVVFLSRLILKESFSAWRWVALVLICIGVAMVGIGGI